MPYEQITRTILNVESASAFEDFIESGKASQYDASDVSGRRFKLATIKDIADGKWHKAGAQPLESRNLDRRLV